MKQKEKFEYNQCQPLDIAFKEMKIRFKKINIVDFDSIMTNINHRPLRQPHVNKIKTNFTGILSPVDVIYDESKNRYFIVQGQHAFRAVEELIDEGKIDKIKRYPCRILLRKSTGKKLIVSNAEDVKLSNRYSYCMNDGQERTCYIDTVKMMFDLGMEFLEKNKHNPKGIYQYIFDNQYGNKKYTKNNIMVMWNEGQDLAQMGLFNKALEERWVQTRIREELGKAKKPDSCYVKIKIFKENQKLVNEHKTDMVFWKRILSTVEQKSKAS